MNSGQDETTLEKQLEKMMLFQPPRCIDQLAGRWGPVAVRISIQNPGLLSPRGITIEGTFDLYGVYQGVSETVLSVVCRFHWGVRDDGRMKDLTYRIISLDQGDYPIDGFVVDYEYQTFRVGTSHTI